MTLFHSVNFYQAFIFDSGGPTVHPALLSANATSSIIPAVAVSSCFSALSFAFYSFSSLTSHRALYSSSFSVFIYYPLVSWIVFAIVFALAALHR